MVPANKITTAIGLLSSSQQGDKITGIKQIKNLIIGNKTNKVHPLFAAQNLIEIECLSTNRDTFRVFRDRIENLIDRLIYLLSDQNSSLELKYQISIVLGSLAYGDPSNSELIANSGVIPIFIGLLASSSIKLVEASARALRTMFLNQRVLFQYQIQLEHLEIMAPLIEYQHITKLFPSIQDAHVNLRVAEILTSVIARAVSSLDYSNHESIYKSVVSYLVKFTEPEFDFNPKLQESTLDALASLCRDNSNLSRFIVEINTPSGNVVDHFLRLLRNKRSSMRLFASACITNLIRANVIPGQRGNEIKFAVLHIITQLFDDETSLNNLAGYGNLTIQEKSPLIFAYLIGENCDLQKAAMDTNAIIKLSKIIENITADETISVTVGKTAVAVEFDDLVIAKTKKQGPGRERLYESCLLAISSACSLREECRKQVIDTNLLPKIVVALSHHHEGIRSAACHLTRSLSRSVKNLRTTLIDAGIAIPIFKLLSDNCIQVKIIATATLCNIVLDFSPMKNIVLENGGIEKLVSLLASSDMNLKLNVVWALKNILYQADSEIKIKVMDHLGWGGIELLLRDTNTGIKEQALNVLRNLACGKESDIEAIVTGFGRVKLLEILKIFLESPEQTDEIVIQCLYIVVNLATGSTNHKQLIITSEAILMRILHHLSHPNSKVRIAATWCIINLTWIEDPGVHDRIEILREIGVEIKLAAMLGDKEIDVKDRVKTALSHFQNTSVPDDMRTSESPHASGLLNSRVPSADFIAMTRLAESDYLDEF